MPAPKRRSIIRKANNKPILDNTTTIKIYQLFKTYKEIPVTIFPLLYYLKHEETFDYNFYGFRGGLNEFFDHVRAMIHIIGCVNGTPIYALRRADHSLENGPKAPETTIKDRISQRNRSKVIKQLMNFDLPLWKLTEIDKSKSYIVDPSPLDVALLKDEIGARNHIFGFHKTLSKYPEGVRLCELCTILEGLNQSFELFGSADVCSITSECFELFHVRQVGGEVRVFDGRTTTYDDLSEKVKDSQKLTAKSILNGLYQKTLLLLSSTNGEGMKLGVWSASVGSNFGPYDPVVQPLEILKAWRDEGLLDIEEGTYFRNNLIINSPKKPVSMKYTHASEEQLVEMTKDPSGGPSNPLQTAT